MNILMNNSRDLFGNIDRLFGRVDNRSINTIISKVVK